ncbi:hypothetical protein NPIL_157571 [Nephila pilipes]|uniref:Uncharacterized protein n=1 Tax=Nephila pilipes TaxID=299642 RepID=A0A8X6J470_NEPPI|nr:hypothetical protein NPIL_157571 [Nephila pilipes]
MITNEDIFSDWMLGTDTVEVVRGFRQMKRSSFLLIDLGRREPIYSVSVKNPLRQASLYSLQHLQSERPS